VKIYFSKYQIESVNPSNARYAALVREGALLKLEDGTNFCGYADLHPYPEFGDQPLDVHLENLAEGRLTALTQRALAFAHTDSLGRRAHRNLFDGLVLPQCHRQVSNIEEAHEAFSAGFQILKIKMGRDLVKETKLIEEIAKFDTTKLRLDFNGVLSFVEFQKWWAVLSDEVKSQIDFIEDAYHEISKLEPTAPLAWDWLRPKKVEIQILKPTRDSLEAVRTDKRIVFTHAFGHLLGQATSLWTAARFYKRFPSRLEVCGLYPSQVTPAWKTRGPKVLPPQGSGFGLDEILREEAWQLLT
jgi:O-succinylbenzoate synthase